MSEEPGAARSGDWRCTKCGHANAAISKFCTECGVPRAASGGPPSKARGANSLILILMILIIGIDS